MAWLLLIVSSDFPAGLRSILDILRAFIQRKVAIEDFLRNACITNGRIYPVTKVNWIVNPSRQRKYTSGNISLGFLNYFLWFVEFCAAWR